MTLGEKIVELRKKEKLTQEKLALQIGISRQTLSNWESDITSPNIKEAKELAFLFKISLDDLLDNQLDIKCQNKNTILDRLIGKNCYIELLEEDYRIDDEKICKVLSIEGDFIKIEFEHEKKIVTKLVDLKLVSTIRTEAQE